MNRTVTIMFLGAFFLKGIQSAAQFSYPKKCKSENDSSAETYKQLKRFVHYQIDERIKDCNLQGCDTDQIITKVAETTSKEITKRLEPIEQTFANSELKGKETDNALVNVSSLIGELIFDNVKLEKELDTLKSNMSSTSTSVHIITNQLEEQKKRPAFMATLGTWENYLTKDQIIKFEIERTNIGNFYDTSSGIFTAPVSGLYTFGVSYMNYDNTIVELRLMQNDNMVARSHAPAVEYVTASIQAVLELKPGDKVYVKCGRDNCNVGGYHYSMFYGQMTNN